MLYIRMIHTILMVVKRKRSYDNDLKLKRIVKEKKKREAKKIILIAAVFIVFHEASKLLFFLHIKL
jgi:hypothetical protein